MKRYFIIIFDHFIFWLEDILEIPSIKINKYRQKFESKYWNIISSIYNKKE